MKINKVTTIIALLLATLLTYAVYALSDENERHIVMLLLMSFVSIATTLLGVMGIYLPSNKHNVNIRILSMVFALMFIIEHASMAILGVSLNALIITTGILLLIYLLLFYTISKATM